MRITVQVIKTWSSVTFAALCMGATLIAACNDDDANQEECESVSSCETDDTVCCETYGMGDYMKKCCEEYAWKLAMDCPIGEYPGGGKRIVKEDCCAGLK